MIKYGLISETDARMLEKTIDLICSEFKESEINVTEVGVYGGDTGSGMATYIHSKGRLPVIIGIDNNKDGESVRFDYDALLLGDSTEVYFNLPDNSQHLIFDDGDHSLIGVISDFFAYADKVKIGGYLAFHDTGKHIKPFKDFQHGDRLNPDAYISVRKALEKIGLFGDIEFISDDDNTFTSWSLSQWKKIFDEADENNEAGGICVFKKMY